MHTEPELWAIVLAGGSGKRLEPLTAALYGYPVPKQFAVIAGNETLIAQTLRRTTRVVPEQRVVVVATETHAAFARKEQACFPQTKLVLQPDNLDTGIGILVGLAQVMARAPQARVLVVPSDHYVRDESRFVQALEETALCGDNSSIALTLLGIHPDCPELEYGWIVPGEPLTVPSGRTQRRVDCFVEKPSQEVAASLLARGALWNTLAFSGRAQACWQLCLRYLPQETGVLEEYRASIGSALETAALKAAFRELHSANFSQLVLSRCAAMLGVIESDHMGWSDIGTPARVFEALDGTPEALLLQRRLDACGSKALGFHS